MTLEQFTAKALKEARQRSRLPDGWWGTYRDATDGRYRVRWSTHGTCWILTDYYQGGRGTIISRHGSRSFAIAKARKLP